MTNPNNNNKIKLQDLTLDHLSEIYEESDWIPKRTFAKRQGSSDDPVSSYYSSLRQLFNELKDTVDHNSSEEEKLELLRAHPDLCHRAAVIAANKNEKNNELVLTDASREEQSRAGLSQLTAEEFQVFQSCNERYRQKFGFPFILAVRNATKHTVLSAIQVRVHNSREVEFAACLAQVHKIAWMRLIDLIEISDDQRGFLTCHVLDTASGTPAVGMRIELYRVDTTTDDEGNNNNKKVFLKKFYTDDDGRLGGKALDGKEFQVGTYEWIFYVGDYFSTKSNLPTCGTPFLDQVPIRFGIDDPEAHYHVPLLVSPYGYSTYRGS